MTKEETETVKVSSKTLIKIPLSLLMALLIICASSAVAWSNVNTKTNINSAKIEKFETKQTGMHDNLIEINLNYGHILDKINAMNKDILNKIDEVKDDLKDKNK